MRAVIPWPATDKYPHATTKSPIEKTCCNSHSDADWTRIQQTLPGADPILLYRLSKCTCGHWRQTPKHLLLECKHHLPQRKELRKQIKPLPLTWQTSMHKGQGLK